MAQVPPCSGIRRSISCLFWSTVSVKLWKKTEADTQYTCEPLRDLRYLFRTTNECHSNEQNLVSGDKISQDSSKEPTQLGRGCTPKQTGDRSSDPWTRRDLSHPGHGNLKLTNVPTSTCYAILMMLMIIPCTVNCLTCFVSAQVNKIQHAVPVQKGYIKLHPTMENITHP